MKFVNQNKHMRLLHLVLAIGISVGFSLALSPGQALATAGSCGSSAGKTLTSKPTTDLCVIGRASSVSGTGPWTWTCNTSAYPPTPCTAYAAPAPVNGVCGSSNGKTLSSKPTTNLCSAGTGSAVSGSGPWTWNCAGANGGSSADCHAQLTLTPVNGKCGLADGKSFATAPVSDLCSAGTGSAVSGSGPWTWNCAGVNGGNADDCRAGKTTVVTCGNGTKDTGESCDDGNTVSGDGCSSTCATEEKDEPKKEDEDKDEDCDGSIGDFVWNDQNGDGKQDTNEKGIASVGVWLYRGNDIDKEKTNSKGEYQFDDLCAGHYTVVVKAEDVPFRTLTSDPDGVLDHSTKVEISRKEDYKKADFGYKALIAPATGPGWVALVLSGASALMVLAIVAKLLARRRKNVGV